MRTSGTARPFGKWANRRRERCSAKARCAEKELFLNEQMAKTRAAGQWSEVEAIEKQLVNELRRLQEDGETKKERVRASRE